MRCTNCGWENPDNFSECEKCGSPLSKSNNVGGAPHRHPSPGSTIREDAPFGRPGQYNPMPPTNRTIINEPTDSTIPGTKINTNEDGRKSGYDGGTIGPWNVPGGGPGAGWAPVAYCKLTPVIFPGEKPHHAPGEVSIKGDTELNRDMLDKDNPTITSKVQAVLTNKDGKWYIQDKSSQRTTFVHAEEPIALKDGDVILMGNRTFIFNED